MRVFELYFNRKRLKETAKGQIPNDGFDVFSFSPTNIYEKRVGSLYFVGKIANILPQNLKLLERLFKTIKQRFYSFPIKNQEQSFKEALSFANDFLAEEIKKNNVSWLGNLKSGVLGLKDLNLNLSENSGVKVALIRDGFISEIESNQSKKEFSSPASIFTNITYGRLSEHDRILVATEEIYSFLKQGPEKSAFAKNQKKQNSQKEFNLLKKLALSPILNAKKIKEIFKNAGVYQTDISGVGLLIDLTSEPAPNGPEIFAFEKKFVPISFVGVLFYSAFLAKKTANSLSSFLAKFRLPAINVSGKSLVFLQSAFNGLRKFFLRLSNFLPFQKKPKQIKNSKETDNNGLAKKMAPKVTFIASEIVSFVKISIKNAGFYLKKLEAVSLKNWTGLAILFILTAIGFFVFQIEEKKQTKENQKIFSYVEQRQENAKEMLLDGRKSEAREIFMAAFYLIKPLAENSWQGQEDALALMDSIDSTLKKIDNFEEISGLEPLFEFDSGEFIPQKMVLSGETLYFSSPSYSWIYSFEIKSGEKNRYPLNKEKPSEIFPTGQKSLAILIKPKTLLILRNSDFSGPIELSQPYDNANLSKINVFNGNLYFLEENQNQLIKYSLLAENFWSNPIIWNKSRLPDLSASGEPLSINGLAYFLGNDNDINVFRAGVYEKTITIDAFPKPKKFYKIYAPLSGQYLYLLEPAEKRLLLIGAEGKPIRQIFSKNFNNLKDFAVSEDSIYILNGTKVYQLGN